MTRSLVLAAALLAGSTLGAAAQYGAPPPVVIAPAAPAPVFPFFYPTVPTWYGPSPFAVTGSAYGLSGYGYYYDEPTEHRLGGVGPSYPRYRRTADLRRRIRR